ncbi:MAG: hypothetical protein D3908_06320 [Candidatus Electrothrix sp. AUS4]|nr:hypothetical protein [Candidatus Electrothrix sp. AUS4]
MIYRFNLLNRLVVTFFKLFKEDVMKKLLLATVAAGLVTIFGNAGSAEATWTSYTKVSYMVSYADYAVVYFMPQSSTLDGNYYYYCYARDSEIRDVLSDALSNNTTVRVNGSLTWETDASRYGGDCTGVLSYAYL